MADLTVTPASVKASNINLVKRGVSGVAILAGQTIFQDTDKSMKLADANGTGAAPTLVGIAVSSAPGVGQPVNYVIEDDDFNPGATTTAGAIYVLSATPGGIAADADLATGMKTGLVGFGKTGNKMILKIAASGQTVP